MHWSTGRPLPKSPKYQWTGGKGTGDWCQYKQASVVKAKQDCKSVRCHSRHCSSALGYWQTMTKVLPISMVKWERDWWLGWWHQSSAVKAKQDQKTVRCLSRHFSGVLVYWQTITEVPQIPLDPWEGDQWLVIGTSASRPLWWRLNKTGKGLGAIPDTLQVCWSIGRPLPKSPEYWWTSRKGTGDQWSVPVRV